jgi:hypothetical protein
MIIYKNNACSDNYKAWANNNKSCCAMWKATEEIALGENQNTGFFGVKLYID